MHDSVKRDKIGLINDLAKYAEQDYFVYETITKEQLREKLNQIYVISKELFENFA